MDYKKLRKIRSDLARLRSTQAKAVELERLAKRLGLRKGDSGKEPAYASDDFLNLRPISIPHHGGRDLAPGTLRSILDQLGDVADRWEEFLNEQKSNTHY